MTDETIATMPERIIKKYDRGYLAQKKRKKEEVKLFELGYKIIEEEENKEWMAGNACCLALIFFPLIFIKTKRIKVTYEKNNL